MFFAYFRGDVSRNLASTFDDDGVTGFILASSLRLLRNNGGHGQEDGGGGPEEGRKRWNLHFAGKIASERWVSEKKFKLQLLARGFKCF